MTFQATDTHPEPRVAVVTGASAGIGAAIGRTLAEAGFGVVLGARRLDLLHEVADAFGGRALPLDVTDPESVDAFAEQVPGDVARGNPGGAAHGNHDVRVVLTEPDAPSERTSGGGAGVGRAEAVAGLPGRDHDYPRSDLPAR